MERVEEVLEELRGMAEPSRLAGMARYGIDTSTALGITVTELRAFARTLGKDHALATQLWDTGIHEARILTTIVDDPGLVTEAQAERWILDVRSWDLCDGLCCNLLDRTPFVLDLAVAWSGRGEEFVKRAGFVLMACAAAHRKEVEDERFVRFLPIILRESTDDRNYVKKGANWALRQIGKRSPGLNGAAIGVAEQLRASDSRTARWIGSDALRELTSEQVQERLAGKSRRTAGGTPNR